MNANISQQSVKKLSPRDIWGKVIIHLRESHFVALYIACGEITDVDIQDGKFVIKTTEEYIYQLLKFEDNVKELNKTFKQLGIDNWEVIKKEKKYTKAQLDLQILKQVVGDKLEIEGE